MPLDANSLSKTTSRTSLRSFCLSRRLRAVGSSAHYLHALDPEREVPPIELLSANTYRPGPDLYSDGAIFALMLAPRQLQPPVTRSADRAATRQPSVVLLGQEHEHEHEHRLPRLPHTLCFGQTRKVDRQATVSVGDTSYSVPHVLIGERVWVRAEAEQLVVVHIDALQGPREVARHQLTTPGRPSINDEHYPPRPAGALERKPRAPSAEEREFLAIGAGAPRWLRRAAAEGTQRIRRKMAEAVDLAKLHGSGPVNNVLDRCASYGRFADGDLARRPGPPEAAPSPGTPSAHSPPCSAATAPMTASTKRSAS
jgi:hypothetical protein